MSCSRLGNILYLEIQKGKESMKVSDFQNNIRGADIFMKIIMKANKGRGKMSSNDTLFD